MKQLPISQPSNVQLINLDEPKLLISHLYALGAFGGVVADLLEILADHNLEDFYEEVAYYMPKRTIPWDLPTKAKGWDALNSDLFRIN